MEFENVQNMVLLGGITVFGWALCFVVGCAVGLRRGVRLGWQRGKEGWFQPFERMASDTSTGTSYANRAAKK